MLASMIRSRGGLVIVEYIYLLVPLLGAICFSPSSNFEFAEIDAEALEQIKEYPLLLSGSTVSMRTSP